MRVRSLTVAVLVLVGGVTACQAQAPAKPAGCGGCHVSFAKTQPFTPMGRALQLTGANTALKAHPKMTFEWGGYTYAVERHGDQSTYTVSDGKQALTLPIRWSFGAKAQTWVLERNGTMYESLVSYYPDLGGLDVTTGDRELKPKSLEEAIGRVQGAEDAKACFGCHTTNAILQGKLDTARLKPGLGCEHCHVGAEQHQQDAALHNLRSLPPDLGALSSEEMSSFCGKCHRTWETVVRSRWTGEMNVRFQPYRLANSKCFDGADPRIGCVACHDPHTDVVREPGFYDGKCLACHGAAPHASGLPQNASVRRETKTCPVAKANCVSCHMPRVTLPGSGGHLHFTDHEIRVVRAGDLYPD